MSRSRSMRSYVIEGLVTIVAVVVITMVMLNRRGTDPSPLQGMIQPPAPTDGPEKLAQVTDGTWRDDFHDMGRWVVWTGEADLTADGALQLRDRPDAGTIVLQKRPLLLDAAEIEIRVKSDGGLFQMAVAASGEGPPTELVGTRDCCVPRDGLGLDLDFASASGEAGRLRWMRDGSEMLSVVTQDRPLPPGEWANVNLSLGPQRCELALDGRTGAEIAMPWKEGSYRIYLGSRGADARVDHVALTVPAISRTAVGSVPPSSSARSTSPVLTGPPGSAIRTVAGAAARSAAAGP
ncbi:MAG: hypothetical protein GF393_11295 [Armatimonadia bacterium]|nr:hypothetical protein [Armatimonadia bacterium]